MLALVPLDRVAALAALVCLLWSAAEECDGLPAHPPASQNNAPLQQTKDPLDNGQHYREICIVSLHLGERSGGGQRLTVSTPEQCRCQELELEVLQRRGIPCQPGSRCAWMTSHAAVTNTSSAEFLESVGGWFRPVARCDLPGPGRPRDVLRLFTGQAVQVTGIDLPTWNATLAAGTEGDDLVVRVLRQMDASGSDAFFPELYVTLYAPPEEDGYYPRRMGFQRVAFAPAENGARIVFKNAALSGLFGYRVNVKPAGSWVCQGANDGCQRRYAMVEDLLYLTEQARINPPLQA